MNIFSALKAYAWQAVAALLFVALAASGFSLYSEKMAHSATREDRDRISLAFSTYIKDQLIKNKDAADAARTREQELQVAADKFRSDAYVQINRLRGERDAAIDGLRSRPPRPAAATNGAGLSAPTGPGAEAQGCTGAQLYRPDAEFLVGIASDYDELRLEYNKLWDIYQRARSQAEAVTGAK